MTLKDLGNSIANVRKSKSLTQETVAFDLDISITSYAKIERGETNVPFMRLVQIAEYFNVPVSELIQEEETESLRRLVEDVARIKDDIHLIQRTLCIS